MDTPQRRREAPTGLSVTEVRTDSLKRELSFSELNSTEFTESIEFVDDYF